MNVIKCKPDKFSSQNVFRASVNSQLDRIERMLKFLCIRERIKDFKEIDDASAMLLHGGALARLKKLIKLSPDISDIIEEK